MTRQESRGVRMPLGWVAAVDGAVDGLIIAFAGWTLFYEIGLASQRSVRWAGWPWLIVAAIVVAMAAWRSLQSALAAASPTNPADGSRTWESAGHLASRSTWLVIGIVLLVIFVSLRGHLGLTPVAVVSVVVLLIQFVPWWRARASSAADSEPVGSGEGPAPWAHLAAAASSIGVAVLASLLLRPDADDAFYVNRATWIAHHGVPVLNDTMFSPNRLKPAYDGGLPTPSIEALQGSLAYALHLQAATVAYVLFVPVLAAIMGWTMWRLVRVWAPRRWLLVFLIAMLFILASGSSIVGNYTIGRIWQGKVTACAILLPLTWLYLTKVANHGRRRDKVLLLMAGIGFVGLTTTSALLAPLIFGAGLIAAFVLRSKALLQGSALFFAAPLINGLAEKFGPTQIGAGGSVAAPREIVFAIAFGAATIMAVLGVVGVVLGPRLVAGRGAVVAAAVSLVTMAAFLPGVLGIANAVTSAGPVIWRLAIAAPVAVLVGLLAVVEVPALRALRSGAAVAWGRGVGLVTAVVVIGCIVIGHSWIWSSEVGGSLTTHPTWKVDQHALGDVRAAERLHVARGRWLLPPSQMQIMSISTTGPYTVVPRDYYLPTLSVPRRQLQDRITLLALVKGQRPDPTVVARALRRLDVTLACVAGTDRGARHELARAVRASLHRVGSMRCWVDTKHA